MARPRVADLVRGARLCARTYATTSKPYYVTTPIYYVNAEPHIGHLHSSIMADVLRRYAKLRYDGWSPLGPRGEGTIEPRLTTGTDEHGMKIQRVAEAQNIEPRALCGRVSERFRVLNQAGRIECTRFIRTTDADHTQAVQHFWSILQERGYLYQGHHEGWYAVSDEAFYPASQVRKVVSDSETYYESIESGQRVEWMTEVNYKFRLSAFQQPLLAWLEANPEAIQPASMYEHILAEVRAGLSDLSVSRPRSRLHWGIPVPNDDTHTMYVWVDALVNYITALGYPSTWYGWPADVHVVGKDIVRFHTIYWPALLMAVGLPVPRTIVAHSHWTVNKMKMSKSKGNSVNPFEAIDKYGIDTIRYYLMRIGGNIGTDADYAPALLEEHKRKFLQGQLGNLLSRVMAPKIQARLASEGAMLSQPAWTDDDRTLVDALQALPDVFDKHKRQWELSKAINAAFYVVGLANEHVQHTAPWAATTSTEAVHRCVFLAMEVLRVCGCLLEPVMPEAMKTLLDVLQVPETQRTWSSLSTLQAQVPLRRATEKIAPLFPRSSA